EVMGDFYRLASRLFDEGRFEDAANAFVFLTTCNPDVPEYWIALGLSLEQTDESSGAYDAYAMGAYLAKDNITYYVKAVDAAVASPLPGRAEALVDLAKSMLELGLETRSEFAGEVKQLEAYVREKLKGGR
ncbi:MAG: hypothetical protein KDK78_07945, partial [Chlamydiia bacterium]|nr:hypothetical protein [Chlamydiia bacterium]